MTSVLTYPFSPRPIAFSIVVASVVACSGGASLPVEAWIGPTPVLPEPQPSFIPTVHVVDAKGWAAGE
jgi:hypothetical protein